MTVGTMILRAVGSTGNKLQELVFDGVAGSDGSFPDAIIPPAIPGWIAEVRSAWGAPSPSGLTLAINSNEGIPIVAAGGSQSSPGGFLSLGSPMIPSPAGRHIGVGGNVTSAAVVTVFVIIRRD